MSRKLFIFASWIFGIATGAGHLFFALTIPETPKTLRIAQMLQAEILDLPGASPTMLDMHDGLSHLMGVMLISFGVINLMHIKNIGKDANPENNILIANIIVTAVVLFFAVVYLQFIPPIVFALTALICLIASLALKIIKPKENLA